MSKFSIPGEDKAKDSANASNFSSRKSKSRFSILGTIPDKRPSDIEVLTKYDFNKRGVDTSHLVIHKVRDKIMVALAKNQVIIIDGFTGCGKTTQVPQFILENAMKTETGCRIAVTQPRRIAAISIASRVAAERKWKLGDLVGYQVGMDRQTSEDTRLTYMTTGVLLQLIISRKNISEWTHIIVDEVHERDVDTDLLLLVIRKIMMDTGNKRTKIILMSATLDPDKFAKYFDRQKPAERVVVDLPVIFPIKEYYLEDAAKITGQSNMHYDGLEDPKVHQECMEVATKVIEGLDASEREECRKNNLKPGSIKPGAVLVFLPGLLEIETMFKILTEVGNIRMADENSSRRPISKWMVLPLHSSITSEEQQRVFYPSSEGHRKIVLATNLAESSITVPDIRYVVDFCLTKNLYCDPTTNYTCLRLNWASKNQCMQRRGRCGRVAEGFLFRMITRSFYYSLKQEAMPEMLCTSLESVVLQVKLLDVGAPKEILSLAVDPPEESNVLRAIANLKEIGALTLTQNGTYDSSNGDVTFMGKVLSYLPIDIRLGRLILLGYAFGCLEEALVIAAGLTVKSPFAYPYAKRLEAYLSKMEWSASSYSDCFAILNLYSTWHERHITDDFTGFEAEKNWARTYFVQVTSLREMKLMIQEFRRRLQTVGIEHKQAYGSSDDQTMILKMVIAGAFYPNYFVRSKPDEHLYAKCISKDLFDRDPFTSVQLTHFPSDQPPELYSQVIAERLAFERCVPELEFIGAKLVVTFQSRGSFTGCISNAVYRAIKLRQLRQDITFYTPTKDKAEGLLQEAQAKRNNETGIPAPKTVTMPGLHVDWFQAGVTHIETPSEFYVVHWDDIKALNEVKGKLATMDDKYLLPITDKECIVGQLCVALVEGLYYRARIDQLHGRGKGSKHGQILVYLLDHGQSKWVFRNLVYTAQALVRIGLHENPPALAMRCRLAQTRASVRTGCVWTEDAVNKFRNLVGNFQRQVLVRIYSVVAREIAGHVYNTDEEGAKTVNEILKQLKFADFFSEARLSVCNNALRHEVQTMRRKEPDVLAYYERAEKEQNDGFTPEQLLISPGRGPGVNQPAVLRGPYSPLEMSFTSMCRNALYKPVITDGASVNCVMLDQEPEKSSINLMVSASVAIASRSGNVMARESTLMPPIPGLSGLLAMLFSPKMELRVDKAYSKYTGCITGLGVDPDKPVDGGIYPDHDMELEFDAQIDEKDIEMINKVRQMMNIILSPVAPEHEEDLTIRREMMRREALRLMERERKIIRSECAQNPYAWNAVDSSRMISVSVEYENGGNYGLIFPLHSLVRLDRDEVVGNGEVGGNGAVEVYNRRKFYD